MLQHAAENAALCDHVYFRKGEETLPAGWQIVQTSDKLLGHKSNFFGALYMKQDPETGEKKYVLAFRGSDGNDLKANFAIAQGKLPRQHAHAVDFVYKACDAAGIRIEDVEVTGHSLGGYLARTVGHTLPVKKVWAFAGPGPGPKTRAYLEKLVPKNSLPNDRIIQIRSKYDVIGLYGSEEKIVLELNTKGSHHAIKAIRNYIDKKLNPDNPQPLKVKTGFLERVFNVVSKKLASSETLRNALRSLFKHTHPRTGRDADISIIPMARPASPGGFAMA